MRSISAGVSYRCSMSRFAVFLRTPFSSFAASNYSSSLSSAYKSALGELELASSSVVVTNSATLSCLNLGAAAPILPGEGLGEGEPLAF